VGTGGALLSGCGSHAACWDPVLPAPPSCGIPSDTALLRLPCRCGAPLCTWPAQGPHCGRAGRQRCSPSATRAHPGAARIAVSTQGRGSQGCDCRSWGADPFGHPAHRPCAHDATHPSWTWPGALAHRRAAATVRALEVRALCSGPLSEPLRAVQHRGSMRAAAASCGSQGLRAVHARPLRRPLGPARGHELCVDPRGPHRRLPCARLVQAPRAVDRSVDTERGPQSSRVLARVCQRPRGCARSRHRCCCAAADAPCSCTPAATCVRARWRVPLPEPRRPLGACARRGAPAALLWERTRGPPSEAPRREPGRARVRTWTEEAQCELLLLLLLSPQREGRTLLLLLRGPPPTSSRRPRLRASRLGSALPGSAPGARARPASRRSPVAARRGRVQPYPLRRARAAYPES